MRIWTTVGALASLASLVACATVPDQPVLASDADVLAVQELVAELDRCARQADLEAFLAWSTDDVISMAPNEPPIVGKDAVERWYRNFYATFDINMTHDPLETHAYADLLIHRGHATGTLIPKAGGDAIEFDNKYLFVLLRQDDGSLKIWRAVFNSNMPPPTAG